MFKLSNNETIKTAYFGSSDFSVMVLEELKKKEFLPDILVSTPDTASGRGLKITPSAIKDFGVSNDIIVLQPSNLKGVEERLKEIDLFLVASYGKIIPKKILDLPKFGTLNIHPSLLPKYRGASPLQSAILNGDAQTGVSIMLVDEKMDHGPVFVQEKIQLENWNPSFLELREKSAKIGARLLLETINKMIVANLMPEEQDHSKASFTEKIDKKEGFIESEVLLFPKQDLEQAIIAERKIRALNPNPGTFSFFKTREKEIRVKITKAKADQDKILIVEKVVPEGKKEMSWADFLRGTKIHV